MFKEVKEKLIKEYNDLVAYYNNCYDKREALSKNTKNTKKEIISGITVVSFIPVLIAFCSLLKVIPFSSINMTLFCASITGVSIGIGYLGQKLITLNANNKTKKFTTC